MKENGLAHQASTFEATCGSGNRPFIAMPLCENEKAPNAGSTFAVIQFMQRQRSRLPWLRTWHRAFMLLGLYSSKCFSSYLENYVAFWQAAKGLEKLSRNSHLVLRSAKIWQPRQHQGCLAAEAHPTA